MTDRTRNDGHPVPARQHAGVKEIVLDDIGPERIFHYYDPQSGMRAAVVIDSTRFGISAGGVRMAGDLTLLELVRLARAMSYKFAMLELPCGGAKAGIWLEPAQPTRPQVMGSFLAAIRPLVDGRAYMPGADMGTSAGDFTDVYPPAQNLGDQEFEGMLLEDQLTGYGVVVAARTACEWLGRSLRDARVAIEGFGKVGAGAAKYFARAGARVVAVSTVHGLLHQPQGLDVPRLLSLRARLGDAALQEYAGAAPLAPRENLFAVECDVLVPGARPDSIHTGNAGSIAAPLIVPAANIPYAAGSVAALHARGIVPLPDFVTNAGGVLAGLVGLEGGGAEDGFRTVEERVAGNVRLVLDAARERGCSSYDAALERARRRIALTP